MLRFNLYKGQFIWDNSAWYIVYGEFSQENVLEGVHGGIALFKSG